MGRFTKRKSFGFIPLDGGVDEYSEPIKLANNRKLKCEDCLIIDGALTFRPGRRLWGPEFDDVFYGVHEYIDPDNTAHLFVASNGYVYEVDATTKTARDSGLTEEELHFFTHRGRARYNGATTQRKITRTTSERVGVDAPENAPTATYGGTGLTGNYAWKYTFVIEVDGVKVWESNPSPALEYTLANNIATLKGDASADTRVNARYFYRTTAGGAIYQYTGKISDNTAGSTLADSTADAALGAILETNHGVPVQASIAEGANERQFFLTGNKLRWSEQAYTEAYLEYQKSTSFKELPGNGNGTGLKRIYNLNTAREDILVFQEDMTHILPQSDPNQPLYTISQKKGCVQQDTIVEYKGKVFFLSNDRTVEMYVGGRLVDITSRNIPVSMKAVLYPEKARASIIFGHYLALCCRSDSTKLYSNQVWVCDLDSIEEFKEGLAYATWFRWNINAEYMIQLNDGSVVALDNNSKRLFKYSTAYRNDQGADAAYTNITSQWQSKDFTLGMFTMIHPQRITIKGQQTGSMTITPYYGNNYRGSAAQEINIAAGSVAVAGVAIAGQSKLSEVPIRIEGTISPKVAGVWVNFLFSKTGVDNYFKVTGFDFTYTGFERN